MRRGVDGVRPDNDKRLYLIDNAPEVVYLKNVVNDPDIEVACTPTTTTTRRTPGIL